MLGSDERFPRALGWLPPSERSGLRRSVGSRLKFFGRYLDRYPKTRCLHRLAPTPLVAVMIIALNWPRVIG